MQELENKIGGKVNGRRTYGALRGSYTKMCIRDSHFGGHTLAAGLGVEKSRIDEFRTAINEYAKTVEMPFPALRLDCKLNPAYINMDLKMCIRDRFYF